MKKNALAVAICASLCGVQLWAYEAAVVVDARSQTVTYPYYLSDNDILEGRVYA